MDAISIISNAVDVVHDYIGFIMIFLLMGAHLFMTVRTRFVQRKTFKAIKLSVTKDSDSHGDISPFQSLATALASTIGTGNIIGNVDVEEFESHGEAYAIGADKDGHAVFKNPHAARKALLHF